LLFAVFATFWKFVAPLVSLCAWLVFWLTRWKRVHKITYSHFAKYKNNLEICTVVVKLVLGKWIVQEQAEFGSRVNNLVEVLHEHTRAKRSIVTFSLWQNFDQRRIPILGLWFLMQSFGSPTEQILRRLHPNPLSFPFVTLIVVPYLASLFTNNVLWPDKQTTNDHTASTRSHPSPLISAPTWSSGLQNTDLVWGCLVVRGGGWCGRADTQTTEPRYLVSSS
jgi:hypothetical protein